jgi:diguanylate cyclase (GGDEF)-like protein
MSTQGEKEFLRKAQRLRLKRFGMAAGTYLLALILTWVTYLAGFYHASLYTILSLSGLVVASQLTFLVLFLRGTNLRFADPSLTAAQVMVGLVWHTTFLANLDEARGALLMFYVIVLLFGVFQLPPRIFARCAAFAFFCFTSMNLIEGYTMRMEQPLQSLLQIFILMLVLLWLSLVAGYVQTLRQRMRQRRVALQAHQDTLRGMMRQLEDLVATDELTGLFNRRHFLRLASREIASLRPGRQHGLALIDLDHFKRINDAYGHATGDRVLQIFASVANTCLREGDVLARYGGEEFVLLLPNSDPLQFATCCERLREAFAQAELLDLGVTDVSLSVGMTMLQMGDDLDQALQRADQALYRAKDNGRNRCEATWDLCDA